MLSSGTVTAHNTNTAEGNSTEKTACTSALVHLINAEFMLSMIIESEGKAHPTSEDWFRLGDSR